MVAQVSLAQHRPVLTSDSATWVIAHKQLAGNLLGQISLVSHEDSLYTQLYFKYLLEIDSIFMGMIREAQQDSKLWFKEFDNDDEKLIYDMNLQQNDSITDWKDTGNYLHVDTVLIQNGRKVIRFSEQNAWGEKIEFIEGVGPNISLLWGCINCGVLSPYSVCKHNGDSLMYVTHNNYFNGCDFAQTNQYENKSNETVVIIYPNPASNFINLKYLDTRKEIEKEFILTGVRGNIVYSDHSFSNNIVIDVSGIDAGIYFLTVNDNKSILYYKILIK